jgi:hypothetical protein
MADFDMGEQFLNFPLDPRIQAVCGIDVKPYLDPEQQQTTWWLRWNRCMIGLKSSPYLVVKGTHLAEESVFRDRHDGSNPLQWSSIHLNLPGSASYDPQLPWVSRLRTDG